MIFLYKRHQPSKTPIVVMKFGGTSLLTPAHITFAADLVVQERQAGSAVIVVVSAMAGVTDRLSEQAAAMKAPESVGRAEIDAILASGEQVAAGLFTLALMKRQLRARSFTGPQAGILTDSDFGNASIASIDCRPLAAAIAHGTIPVVTGFQGADGGGRVTTLGRGGSDTTAVALAAAFGAESCDIYTDVDGVYSHDPLRSQHAVRLDQISYDDMLAMALDGARVLHPTSVTIAKQFDVAVHVRSTFSADTGTWVGRLPSRFPSSPARLPSSPAGSAFPSSPARGAGVGDPSADIHQSSNKPAPQQKGVL